MLVSKNPYVVEARQNLSPKSPYFTLKTGEKSSRNLRLKSLIFIIEKYGKKLLFSFLSQNTHSYKQNAFTLAMLSYCFYLPVFVFKQITYCLLQG